MRVNVNLFVGIEKTRGERTFQSALFVLPALPALFARAFSSVLFIASRNVRTPIFFFHFNQPHHLFVVSTGGGLSSPPLHTGHEINVDAYCPTKHV